MKENRTREHDIQVCFFGTFPATYTVSRILERAAHDAGLTVLRCHESFAESPLISPQAFRAVALARHFLRYGRSALRLWPRVARCPAQILVAGFRGQLDVLWASYLGQARGRRLVFAPLVTVSETREDRHFMEHRPLATRCIAWLDRQSLNLADRVVIDTHAHADYLRSTFALPPEKVRVFPLGADVDVFKPSPPAKHTGTLRVLFYGSFLPLHGVHVIVAAAKLLARERNIRFTLCGEGWQWADTVRTIAATSLTNVTLRPWVEYPELPNLIAEHDVCLGIFGGTQKARMVIPNKVYQCAAVGRPVVSGDSPAVREVFTHEENILLVPPENPEALAAALVYLYRNPVRRRELAHNAAQVMAERFSPQAQARRFLSAFIEALV